MSFFGIQGQEDIIIRARLEMDLKQADFSAVTAKARAQIGSLRKELKGVSAMDAGALAARGLNKQEEMTRLSQGISSATDSLDKLKLTHATTTASMRKNAAQLGAAWQDMKPKFHGFALTFLLAGMQLKAVLQQTWREAGRTFNDVMHSVDGSVTGFDMLAGSIKYLQFQLGEAFEPIAMWLSGIVMSIAEIIDGNEKWVGYLFGRAGLIAGLLIVVGQTVLFAQAVKDASIALGLIKATQLTKVGTAAGTATTAIGTNTSGLMGGLFNLKNLIGTGMLLYVGYQLANKKEGEKWSMSDWMDNLGMAAAGGWMVGGPWGAGIALAVTIFASVAQEVWDDVKKLASEVAKAMSGKISKSKGFNEESTISGLTGRKLAKSALLGIQPEGISLDFKTPQFSSGPIASYMPAPQPTVSATYISQAYYSSSSSSNMYSSYYGG
jgi:hypothetical protein